MKRLITAAVCVLLSSCSRAGVQDVQTVAEQTSAHTTAQTAVQTAPQTTEVPERPEPLRHTSAASYYEDDDISLVFGIKELRSSLLYPAIVHDIGAYPDMFVLECEIRAKNISLGDLRIDYSDLSLVTEGKAVLWGAEDEIIPAGSTVKRTLLFLCTVAQADDITGIEYRGQPFECAEELLPDSVRAAVTIQSEADVRHHLYRKYALYTEGTGKETIMSEPTVFDYSSYYADDAAGYSTGWDGRKQRLVVDFDAYNRSDYAQLFRPASFMVKLHHFDDNRNETECAELMPYALCADGKLMYRPHKADVPGRKNAYEVPEFFCQSPKGNKTSFSLIYEMPFFDPAPHHTQYEIYYDAQGHTEPYWAAFTDMDEDMEAALPDILGDAPVAVTKEEGISYSSDAFDITIEFLSAEDRSFSAADYSISRTQLNAVLTLSNKTDADMVFYPHKLALRHERNAGDMRIESEEAVTVPAGSTVTYDAPFFGKLDTDAGIREIIYLEFDDTAQIGAFAINTRTAINEAIKKIL